MKYIEANLVGDESAGECGVGGGEPVGVGAAAGVWLGVVYARDW